MCIGAGTVSFHGLEAGAGARGLWEEEGEGWEGGREAAVGGGGGSGVGKLRQGLQPRMGEGVRGTAILSKEVRGIAVCREGSGARPAGWDRWVRRHLRV